MEKIDINNELIERIKKINYLYADKIPSNMQNYYVDILNGNNIGSYMQMFSLTEGQLIEYAKVCKLINIYSELLSLINMINPNDETEDISLYQKMIDDLEKQAQYFVDEIELANISEEEQLSSDNTNLIIYPSFIEQSYNSTINSKSGLGMQSMKCVTNLINDLLKSDYIKLRQKGIIHQVKLATDKDGYLKKSALERIGVISTKLMYVRVPISQNNKDILKSKYNINFELLFLTIYFGDFCNEGLSEKDFYAEKRRLFTSHINELLYIFNLFENDFTDNTLNQALKLIFRGMDLSDFYIDTYLDMQKILGN